MGVGGQQVVPVENHVTISALHRYFLVYNKPKIKVMHISNLTEYYIR